MNQQTEKLSVIEKVGTALGDLSRHLVFQPSSLSSNSFNTDVYKIP